METSYLVRMGRGEWQGFADETELRIWLLAEGVDEINWPRGFDGVEGAQAKLYRVDERQVGVIQKAETPAWINA